MIEIQLPNDITKVETKFLGLITKRQLLCITIAAVLTFSMRALLKGSSMEFMMDFLTIVTAGIPCSFCVKVQCVNMEDFIFAFISQNVLSPANRKYRTESVYDKEWKKEKKEQEEIKSIYYHCHRGENINKKHDPKEKPTMKIDKKHKEFTGYI